MSIQFEADYDTLDGVLVEAAEAFGKHIAKEYFGEEHIDWSVTGGETFGGQYVFDFSFDNYPNGRAEFQMQIVGMRNMEKEPLAIFAEKQDDGTVHIHWTDDTLTHHTAEEFEILQAQGIAWEAGAQIQ